MGPANGIDSNINIKKFNLKKITAHGAALLCGEQGGRGVGTGAGIH
jgi:hypothetical protein